MLSLESTENYSVDPLVEEMYERRKKSSRHQADWRQDAREDYEFFSGEQWDSTDKAKLEEMTRPIVTFNRIAPLVESVAGNEINNRQEVKYIPRGEGDGRANEIYNEAARWVRDQCDAEDEESDAFQDAIICGMGWVETHLDYEEHPDGQITLERVPPLEMRWDPASRKKNLIDLNWMIREKKWSIKDVREKWPGKADEITPTPATIEDDEWLDEHDATDAWKYEQDWSWDNEMRKDDKVLVVHYQWREREHYYRVGDQESGRVIEFTEAKFARIRDYVETKGIVYVRQVRWKYKQAFIAGKTLLEESDAPINGFSYRSITGKRDEKEGTWYGLLRSMKDPQRWANKFLSTAMDIFMTNSKGGVIVEENAIDEIREFENNWASPEGVVVVRDGALAQGKIKEKTLGGYPSSLDKLLQFAISSIRDCVGINLEMLGMADRDQPGILEMERKKAALVILAPILNSLRRYRKFQGRDLLQFMRRYIPEGTVVRVTDAETLRFWKDDETQQYDVIVDTAPTSPNLKQEVWGTLSNLIPSLVKSGVPVPPDLIRYSPLPESVAEEWIKYIEEKSQNQIPPEAQKQMEAMQQQAQKLGEENKKLQDKREMGVAQLMQKREEAQVEAQIEAEKIQMANRNKQMELQLHREVEHEKAQLAREKVAAEIELKQATASCDADLKKTIADSDVKIKKEEIRQKSLANDKGDTDRKGAIKSEIDATGIRELVAEMKQGEKKNGTDIDKLIQALNKPRKIVREGGKIVGIR